MIYFSFWHQRATVHHGRGDKAWLQEQEAGSSHFHPHTGRRENRTWCEDIYTQCLPQCHISSSEALPPNDPITSSNSPPSGDQVFKYRSLQGTFLFPTTAVAFTYLCFQVIRQRGDGQVTSVHRSIVDGRAASILERGGSFLSHSRQICGSPKATPLPNQGFHGKCGQETKKFLFQFHLCSKCQFRYDNFEARNFIMLEVQ